MEKANKATLVEVARHAGVSTATVSRVLNRSANVSPEIGRRVQAAAEKLGFNLQRKSGNRVIAFLLGNRPLLHPFHSHVLVGSESCCAERDYGIVFFPLHYPNDVSWGRLHLPRILQRGRCVDGFVVAGVNAKNLLRLLEETARPFAVLGDTVQGSWEPERYDVVWVDNITGGYEMTRYLQSLGHKNIWYVANTRLTWFDRRLQGYLRAMEEGELKPRVSSLDSANEREVGFLGAKYILLRGEPVDAIFCGSDAVCQGVYSALREAGTRIPDDISVTGFNDTLESTALHPPLTSVRVFPDHIGRLLAGMVMDRITDPKLPPQHHVVPTQVVKRESCRQSSSRLEGHQQRIPVVEVP